MTPLFPPSRRTHSVHPDSESARDGAYNLARLLNGVPYGFVLYTAPRMGAWTVCSCRTEEMAAWKAWASAEQTKTQMTEERI